MAIVNQFLNLFTPGAISPGVSRLNGHEWKKVIVISLSENWKTISALLFPCDCWDSPGAPRERTRPECPREGQIVSGRHCNWVSMRVKVKKGATLRQCSPFGHKIGHFRRPFQPVPVKLAAVPWPPFRSSFMGKVLRCCKRSNLRQRRIKLLLCHRNPMHTGMCAWDG